MKKLGFIVAAVLLASCAKVNVVEYQTVTFHLNGVESGAMTRTSTADEVNAILDAAFPTSVSLTLVNSETSVSYTATTGTAVTLPIGEYTVTGKYKPSSQNAYNGSMYSAASPSFTVSSTVTITSGESSYSIPLTWTSTAIFIDATEVSALTWKSYANQTFTQNLLTNGDTKGFFLCGSVSVGTLDITLTPCDASTYATTIWNLSSVEATANSANKGLFIEAGKWYRLHPDGVVTESGTLSLDGAWTCGLE